MEKVEVKISLLPELNEWLDEQAKKEFKPKEILVELLVNEYREKISRIEGVNKYAEAIYYSDQKDWQCNDFYQLNRSLLRLFTFAKKRIDEIAAMDLSLMSAETKALICAIIDSQGKQKLFEFDNLAELRNFKPLEKKLKISESPMDMHQSYMKYNIMFNPTG